MGVLIPHSLDEAVGEFLQLARVGAWSFSPCLYPGCRFLERGLWLWHLPTTSVSAARASVEGGWGQRARVKDQEGGLHLRRQEPGALEGLGPAALALTVCSRAHAHTCTAPVWPLPLPQGKYCQRVQGAGAKVKSP